MLVGNARIALRFLGVPEDRIAECGNDLVKLDQLTQEKMRRKP